MSFKKKILALAICLLVLQSCSTDSFVVKDTCSIIAHRGGSDLGNENTLSCIERGIQSGADMIEIDVHLTKDGFVVVCHDETIDRTTNMSGRIEDLTLQEIRSAKIVDKDGNPTNECIPTLEEVLNLIYGRCSLLLEIKLNREGQYPGLSSKVLGILDTSIMYENTVVQSFNDVVLEEIHSLDSNIRLEKLIFCRLPFGLCFDGGFNTFSFDKYWYVSSVNSCGVLTTKNFVRDAHLAGKEVKIWTIDRYSKLIPEVDGVITNNPPFFIERRVRK